jgi:hypothetical protein
MPSVYQYRICRQFLQKKLWLAADRVALFFQEGQGELVFCAIPLFIAAVAFGLFFTAFFANLGSNVLLLLFTVAEAGSADDYRLFF